MAELRLNPVTRRWVVSGKRPVMPDVRDRGALCPFCRGNEHLTPKAICEWRDASGAWGVRIFHDRAPLVRIEGGMDSRAEGMFDRMNAVGAHEIVVETPQHGLTMAQFPPEHVAKVTELCRDRIFDLKRDRRFRYVSLFKDQHPPSPSLPGHSYSQILATPVLPQLLEIEFRWCRAHFLRKERCLFCDILQQEVRQGTRVVDQTPDFIALCPFASRSPYEVWVLPLRHASSFEKDMAEPARVSSLASFLKSCLQRLEKISETLHVVVHTEPNLDAYRPTKDWWRTIAEDFHWHIEIHPDVEGQRRYLGSEGFYFNPIPAEEAAIVLRALEPGTEPPRSSL
jgi:UDPglucose--hexose-1-phosphate uridylyltransferase